MNAPGEISFHRTADAIHFQSDGREFLELRRGGECIIRSIAPDGTPHVHTQLHPELLKSMVSVPGASFAIAIETIPVVIAEHFMIPSVIALFPSAKSRSRILMAREPLNITQLNQLRQHLGPIIGILNGGRLYRHKSDVG